MPEEPNQENTLLTGGPFGPGKPVGPWGPLGPWGQRMASLRKDVLSPVCGASSSHCVFWGSSLSAAPISHSLQNLSSTGSSPLPHQSERGGPVRAEDARFLRAAQG